MKKLLSGFFAALLACAVVGCGDSSSAPAETPATPAPEAEAADGGDEAAAEPAAEEEAAE